jgi:alpha-1,6-mannosyltransferase
MRIVRLANFIAPHSGGLRTTLAELGAGYLAAGHEPVLVIPGERDSDERTAQGRVITLRAPRLPFTGGYRVLWRRRRLARQLAALRPDALEVSDRTTLRWTGAWARERGVPAVMVSHESVTALLRLTLLGPVLARAVADWLNRRTARAYHRVICTTSWAATEFERIGADGLVRVPLGVDLATFRPGGGQVRSRYAGQGQILLVHAGRLSAEKKPQRSLTTLATLRAGGMPVRLVVAGDGPLRSRLARRAARGGLPVIFAGFLPGRADLAALLARADVAIAPGPAETFGLAALEALACGTPVVVSAESALPEVVGEASAAVPGEDLAAGVRAVLARPEAARRAAARARAERYDWGTSVRGFLAVHRAAGGLGGSSPPEPAGWMGSRSGGGGHDEVRGAGRLDYRGRGRPGPRWRLARLGRAAGRHAAPGRDAQPGHAGRAGRRRGTGPAAGRRGAAPGRGQRGGRHQRHAPGRF